MMETSIYLYILYIIYINIKFLQIFLTPFHKKKPLNDILTFRHFDILYKPKNDEK